MSGHSKVSFAAADSNTDLKADGILHYNKSEGQLQKEEEEEKKQAKSRLAALESSRRVRAYKRKQKREKNREAKRVKSESAVSRENNHLVYQPHEDPAFFDLQIEKRHAEHLGKKLLDKETRLQVIYRILKDQLRIAKKQLLTIKKNNAAEQKKAMELKKKIEESAQKKEEGSIAEKIKEVIDEEGSTAFKFIGS